MNAVKLALFLLLTACLAPAASAQGQGVVDGRLVNGTNSAGVPAQVQVDVLGMTSGMSVIKSSVTDAAGKFRMDGLPAGAPLLIRADYKSVNYYAQAAFDASGTAHVEIQVYEPTASMQGIRLDSAQMAFKLTREGLNSIESYTFINETKPPQSFMREDGNFRFSKAPGILEPPRLDVSGPGSSMPVLQSPLESPDGQSYYSLYPLRPGTTTFDVAQALPYENQTYVYRKKFYQDVPALNIGVGPQDMTLSGEGVKRIQTDAAQNFTVYSAGPFKAGTEVVWTFSGGTPVAEAPAPPPTAPAAAEPSVRPMPSPIAQNALIIGPMLLAGFLVVLWYAQNHGGAGSASTQETRLQELRARREQLLTFVAGLDARYENQSLERREYLRLREQGKRHLRRIAMLLANKQS